MNAPALQLTGSELIAPSAEVPLAGRLTFGIPIEDTLAVDALKGWERKKLELTLRILERMHCERRLGDWIKKTNNLGALYKGEARGLSGPSLRRKYADFIGSNGDWRVLVDSYKGPSAQPEEFVDFVRKLADLNHRGTGAAMRKIREVIWPSGQPVPGYGTWMEWYARQFPLAAAPSRFPLVYPQGFSVRNLRRYGPKKSQLVTFQRGLAAAHSHFPSVKRDPSGLRPMELIVIDDFELDVMCVFRGDRNRGPQLAYVAGLMATDVATRKKLAWGTGPKLTREVPQKDGTVKIVRSGISRLSVQDLIYSVIERCGLPDYPVTILCENATASISPEMELSLSTLFGGRIQVKRTSMLSNKTLANGFIERGGAPWEKGWMESDLNYIWNEMGDAAGYKGSNERLNAPADLADKIRYTQILIGQGKGKLNLPDEVVAQLKLPFKTPEELDRHLAVVIARSELRTDHRLLGFDRVTEFTLEAGDAPRPFTELALLSRDQQERVRITERMESPAERWGRLTQQHGRLPVKANLLAMLLLMPLDVTYRNNAVTLRHQNCGYTYVDVDGNWLPKLKEGTKLLGYFNARDPRELHLSTLDGRYAGTLTLLGGRAGGVDILDEEALDLAREQRAKIVNRDIAAIRARHEDLDGELGGMRAHNDALIAAHRASILPPAAAKLPGANPRPLSPSPSGAAAPVAACLEDAVAGRREVVLRDRATQRTLRRIASQADALLEEPKGAAAPTGAFNPEDLL